MRILIILLIASCTQVEVDCCCESSKQTEILDTVQKTHTPQLEVNLQLTPNEDPVFAYNRWHTTHFDTIMYGAQRIEALGDNFFAVVKVDYEKVIERQIQGELDTLIQ